MKFRVMVIKGNEKDYKRRVYLITEKEKEEMKIYTTFVIRKATTGETILKSVETDKLYLVEK